MELMKNIFFNTDKLVENSKIKVLYNGKLFEDDSKDLFIHYGFGFEWNNLNDLKMEKTDLGFSVEINLLEGDSLNFCFRNSNNVWDNNNYSNYVFPIEKCEKALVVTDIDENQVLTYKPLRKSYLLKKKFKIAFYKLALYVPKLIKNCKSKIKVNN
ncbi:MAG: carbohydrate-binding protein [Clostridia bacterium]|nr:carbohydrate-binding protein [Clostridia bacterium]